MTTTFLKADQVAAEIGLANAAAFLNRRQQMEDTHDFPPPMPHIKRPLLWRADQVLHWVNTQGAPAPETFTPYDDSNVVMLRAARAP